MSERFFQLSNDHGLNENFELCYGPDFRSTLKPCQPIYDYDLYLAIVDNNNINPRRLELLPKDRTPINVYVSETGEVYDLEYPGKSAIICFTEKCDRSIVNEIVSNGLGGSPDRRDHLHVASVKSVINAGWIPYWAPLQLESKILHARMVAQTTIDTGSDPSPSEVARLAKAFAKAS